jgi:hypothetical protein
VFNGLDLCLAGGIRQLLVILLGLILGWWLYVPIHEMLHALACVAAGGHVISLEISAIYGGGLLEKLLPFVVSHSQYAGRLSRFDSGGSDLVYLMTDLGPFLLTLFPGVWLLRVGANRRSGLIFGISLPFALAPLISLTGDGYEIGAILVTRIPSWQALAEILRADDLFLVPARLQTIGGIRPWLGLACASSLGCVWAWATCLVGGGIASLLGRGPLERMGRVGLRR